MEIKKLWSSYLQGTVSVPGPVLMEVSPASYGNACLGSFFMTEETGWLPRGCRSWPGAEHPRK